MKKKTAQKEKIFVSIVSFIGGIFISFITIGLLLKNIDLALGVTYTFIGASLFSIFGYVQPRIMKVILFPLFIILGGI